MNRKILKRAWKIKNYCGNRKCDRCDFSQDSLCIVMTIPEDWELPELKEKKKTITYVKPLAEILKHAASAGAKLKEELDGFVILYPGVKVDFIPGMVKYCGRPLNENPYEMQAEWLEEREE